MKKETEFITIPQLARILGLSRIAVYKQVKSGKIKAQKAGRMYLIPAESINGLLGKQLSDMDKDQIETAVHKTIKDYGEVIRLLGKE